MGELGYHRSAKKCREKFENVYKYHKRTKDGRVGKSEGKNYRFFQQLEALELQYQQSHPPLPPLTPRSEPQPPPHPAAQDAVPVRMVIPAGANPGGGVTVTSSPHGIGQAHLYQVNVAPVPHQQSYQQQHSVGVHHDSPIQMENVSSPSGTLSSSSSTSSDEELVGRRKRKRKWKEFFERKMKEVIDKQEELQKRFFVAVEARERERLAKEDAWKAQEMNRLKREHEILAHERAIVAAKDAALIEILKKISDQPIPLSLPIEITQTQTQIQTQSDTRGVAPVTTSTATTITRLPPSPPQTRQQLEPPATVTQVLVQEKSIPLATPIQVQAPPQSQPKLEQQALVRPNTTVYRNVELQRPNNGGGESQHKASPSRWPKAEVEALINLRTKMDQKYQENGPKGPLWEEISSLMKNIGYNRNAKRCKEKWENINKYFKKVKESNKKRPEDSKTCPYFHQLDALYQQKTSVINPSSTNVVTPYNGGSVKLENLNTMDPNMVQPEQQWRGGQDHAMSHVGSDSDSEGDGDGDGEDDDDGDDQESGGYEIVPNNNGGGGNVGLNSVTSATTTTTTPAAQ